MPDPWTAQFISISYPDSYEEDFLLILSQYAVYSSLLSLHPCYMQVLSSASCSQTASIYTLPLNYINRIISTTLLDESGKMVVAHSPYYSHSN
jgi:hypothetical protein